MKKRKPNKRPAVLFDLDNTITHIDTIIPFLSFYAKRRPARIPRIIGAVLASLLAVPRIISNERMKRIMSSIFRGENADDLASLGEDFALTVKPLYLPDALAAIARHRAKGHILVLVSASYEFYLTHIARDLGFDHVIGSVLWRHGNTITGTLYGKNCRGNEKVLRLRTERFMTGIDLARSYAYGDSVTDAPMLSLVKNGIAVNPGTALTRLAASNGYSIVRWERR
ncbi:MAG: HAD-IB family hydrolase [Spirochaetota bacterium]